VLQKRNADKTRPTSTSHQEEDNTTEKRRSKANAKQDKPARARRREKNAIRKARQKTPSMHRTTASEQ